MFFFSYIAAGELASDGVAGLVEEDGDELEWREQERPPQLQKIPDPGESETPGSDLRESIDQRAKKAAAAGGTHEEDDDGGRRR